MIITARHDEAGLHFLAGEPEEYDAQPRYSGLVLTHWPQETSESRMALAKILAFWFEASTRVRTAPDSLHPATAELVDRTREYWVPSIHVQYAARNIPTGGLTVDLRRSHEPEHDGADVSLVVHPTGDFTGHYATLREHHIGSNSFLFDDLAPAHGSLMDLATALIFGDDLKMGRLLMTRPSGDSIIVAALPDMLRSVGIRLEWS